MKTLQKRQIIVGSICAAISSVIYAVCIARIPEEVSKSFPIAIIGGGIIAIVLAQIGDDIFDLNLKFLSLLLPATLIPNVLFFLRSYSLSYPFFSPATDALWRLYIGYFFSAAAPIVAMANICFIAYIIIDD